MVDNQKLSIELNDFLPYRLDYLAKVMSRSVSAIYKEEFGITVPEWRVTAFLGEFHEMTSSQLCSRSLMDKVMVSRAISGLRKKGWVKEVTVEEDNRAKRVFLSDKGMQCYQKILPRVQLWEKSLLHGLTESEQKLMLNFLDRLEGALNTK